MQVSVDVRASGIGAAAAFLLSALVGLISGVSFGTVLLRALLSGIVFGVGMYGARILLARYIPDLLNADATESTGPGVGATGPNVDISVGDEGDDTDFAAGATDDRERGIDGFDESLVEEVEEAPAVEAGRESEARRESAEREPGIVEDEDAEFLDRSDELPELEGFSGTFSGAAPPEEKDDGSAPQRRTSDSEGLDSLDDSRPPGEGGEGNDPKVMAEAIRTVLKREN